jgi:predicted ATP-grasp superfamily ATP-dependent carboligase
MNIQTMTDSIQIHRAVLGFSGWPDAGKLIEFCFIQLAQTAPQKLVAVWDLDGYWQIDTVRPQISVQHGQIQQFTWPSFQFFTSEANSAMLSGYGPEPSSSWRAFANELIGQLKAWGCREIYLLGSLLDQILHDEVMVSGVVQDSAGYNRVRELGCKLIEYEGQSAVHAAIMLEARRADIRCMTFWAHLPFYISGPNELIAAEVLRLLSDLLGVDVPTDELRAAWKKREKQIEQLVQQDQGLRHTLESLKKHKVMRAKPSSKVLRFEDFMKKRSDDPENE